MFVLRCVDLYIKAGGFTLDVREAKRYRTVADARRDRVTGWTVVKIDEPQRSQTR